MSLSDPPVATPLAPDTVDAMTPRLALLFAVSVAVIVVNLFAPQTLIGLIGPSLGLPPAQGGLISMATLLGYAAGLFLLVPLADLVENRRLVVVQLITAIAAAGAALFCTRAEALLAMLFLLGAACSAIQVLVPIAAHMAAPQRRGRVIGDVMGGLMAGILLSRPLASLIADAWGWRAFYGLSAGAMTLLTLVLAARLPIRRPTVHASYPALIGSLWHLLREEGVLRRRALSASLAMGVFSLFWTAVALRLAQPPFALGQRGIAVFALAGAGGAVVTPWFGRVGDRGWTRPATLASHAILLGALGLAAFAGLPWAGGAPHAWWPLLGMGAAAVLVDVGVTGDQTLGRRAINLLRPEARGRINGIFVGVFFLGGAAGSALAGVAWAVGGWSAVCAAGALCTLAALATAAADRSDNIAARQLHRNTTMLAPIQPTPVFKDNLQQLPPIDGIAAIDLLDGQGKVVATIENQPGRQGSLAVYHYLSRVFGALDAKAAEHGLAVFAEHTADARDRPGAHPNVDRLLGIIAGGEPLRIEVKARA